MNQYSKENAFNRVVRNLENEPGIFNIEKEKGMDFNLTCILYNKVKLIFNLRADADILIIKGEAMYDGIESNELSNIGEMLFTNKEISCTAYENKLVIQSVVPLGDLGETDAMGKVVQKTNNFVGTVKSKLEELSDFNDLTSGAEAINDKKTSHDTFTPEENVNLEKNNPNNQEKNNENVSKENKMHFSDETLVSEEEDDVNNNSEKVIIDEQNNNKEPEMVKEEQKNEEEDINFSKSEKGYIRAPQVVEQMKEMYEEWLPLIRKRKEILDDREKTLDQYASQLERKTQELNGKKKKIEEECATLEDLKAKKLEEVEIKRQNLNAKWEEYKMQKDTLSIREKKLEEKEKLALNLKDIMSDSNECNTSSNSVDIEKIKRDAEEKLTNKEQEIKSLKNELEDAEEKLTNKEQEINSFKNELEKASKTIEALNKTNKQIEEDLEKIKKDTIKVPSIDNTVEINKLKEEIEIKSNKINQLEIDYNAAKAEAMELAKYKEENISNSNFNVDIVSRLETIGFPVKKIDNDDGTFYYTGTKNNCEFNIYPDINTLTAKKEVKKGYKYQENIRTLNSKTNRCMYSYDSKHLYCHFIYDDVAIAVNHILKDISLFY